MSDNLIGMEAGTSLRNKNGQGGDIIFIPGRGSNHYPDYPAGMDGSIVFRLADGTDFMRIEPDGVVTVKGNEVASDREAYLVFRAWLAAAGITLGQGSGDGEDAKFIPGEPT